MLGKTEVLKRYVPERIKRAVKEASRRRSLSRVLEQILQSPPVMPGPETLDTLRRSWGNEGWSGSIEYLEEVARRALNTSGPVLECGSGLTTVLLGVLAGRRGIEVWTLEESEEWRSQVSGILEEHHIPGVRIRYAPLRDYGGFPWYSVPADMPDEFKLVICDGPGASYDSRYGLLPVAGSRLPPGATILVDDSTHMAEIMGQWLTTMPVELEKSGPRFSELRVAPKRQAATS